MIKSNDAYGIGKLVDTELLVIRMERPFAAKAAANWVIKKWF